jgi:uncharacterized protein (DUF849 family)
VGTAPRVSPHPAPERTFQVALNGDSDHPAMPRTAVEIAADAAACVAAGANLLHLHAFDDDGVETLAEAAVSRTVLEVRRSCPRVPISMTTFAQIEPDPVRRLETIAAWAVLPDLVPANQGEEGIVELTELLAGRGVGVEACVFTVDEAELLVRRGGVERFRRVVVEPQEADPTAACDHAAAIEEVLAAGGVTLEQLHHGAGPATWPVLLRAVERGHGIRVGLEDTSLLPDGSLAPGNRALVEAATAYAAG